jgi:hypothetical protein
MAITSNSIIMRNVTLYKSGNLVGRGYRSVYNFSLNMGKRKALVALCAKFIQNSNRIANKENKHILWSLVQK